MTLISSNDNKLVKSYTKLRDKSKERKAEGLYVIEGARLTFDAALSGAKICESFITEKAREKYSDYTTLIEEKTDKVYTITDQVAAHLSDTKASQGVFAVVKIENSDKTVESLNESGAYLALENIQDPGNLGTILRTAEAMGINAVLLSKGCTDLYSPKVVRASMGAVFRLPILVSLDIIDTINTLKENGIRVYAAVATGGEDILKLKLGEGSCAVIGNEGNGLTDECIDACTAKATIHMRGRAESLNAATAASVIIWEMTKNLG